MERTLLRTLQSCHHLHHLRQTHLQILVHGLGDSNHLLSKLLDLSSTVTNSTTYSLQIFQSCPTPDVTTHNFMIKCLNAHKLPLDAFVVYNHLCVSGVRPNSYTFTFIVKSCELLGSLERGRVVHGKVFRCGYGSHLFVMNCLLDFYSKFGGLGIAWKVFDRMLSRDVCSWNSMINACLENGERDFAIEMFERMPERNVVSWNSVVRGFSKVGDMELARSVFDRMTMKNELSWNSMITGYAALGDMVAAQEVFNEMVDKTVVSWTAMIMGYARVGDLESMSKVFALMPVKNVVSWNAMIAGYNQNLWFSCALETFHQMLIDGNFVPNEMTMISVVSACTQLGALEHGNWVRSYIQKNKILIEINLGNALIDMFAKCGDVKTAVSIFRAMTRRCIITWTTMISGLGLNGKSREALSVFEEMCREGIEPDDTVFIALLTACTHGGLVKEGWEFFYWMVRKYGIKPRAKHYGCIVDLLGRAGKLEEAIRFIESMPFEPESVMWAALLSYCNTFRKSELVDYVSRKIADLDPLNSGYQVLISNTQASVGRWREVADARHVMRCMGLEKVPGCSSIQVGDKVHEFLVKDARHKMRKEIYEVLDGLTGLLRQVAHNDIFIQNF